MSNAAASPEDVLALRAELRALGELVAEVLERLPARPAADGEPAGRWLTAEQVAAAYGLTVKAVYRRVSRGQLPALRLGPRSLRFDRRALDRLLQVRPRRAPLAARVPSPQQERGDRC